MQFQGLFHNVRLYTPTLQPLNHDKFTVQVGAKASVPKYISSQPPAQEQPVGTAVSICIHLLRAGDVQEPQTFSWDEKVVQDLSPPLGHLPSVLFCD